jgi:hypothetical protein
MGTQMGGKTKVCPNVLREVESIQTNGTETKKPPVARQI